MTHGRHVKILGQASAERLRDVKGIETLLEGTIRQLGMRLLGEPHMYEVEEEIAKLGVEPFEDEGGVTGVAVLSTSHCAIHTWPLRGFFVMDVYSCRDFEPADLERALRSRLRATRLQLTDVTHALEWRAEPVAITAKARRPARRRARAVAAPPLAS
jgi:S-adenosylmethionine decarboxylase